MPSLPPQSQSQPQAKHNHNAVARDPAILYPDTDTDTDTQIIRRAVSGMLPKNTHRDRRLERLKIFPGDAPAVYRGNAVRTWRDQLGLGIGAESPALGPHTGVATEDEGKGGVNEGQARI
jgi:hypothetical protein